MKASKKKIGANDYQSRTVSDRIARRKAWVEWYSKNKQKRANLFNRSRWRARLKVIEYYSLGANCCNCCGESIIEFLTIDHVNNDGAKHRKAMSDERVINGGKAVSSIGGLHIVYWLIKNGLPPGFQILCYNCNSARRLGKCPHETLDPLKRFIPGAATESLDPFNCVPGASF